MRTHSGQGFEPFVVAFDSLYLVVPGIAAVAVHDESDVPGHRALAESANEQFAKVCDGKLGRRGAQDPAPEPGEV